MHRDGYGRTISPFSTGNGVMIQPLVYCMVSLAAALAAHAAADGLISATEEQEMMEIPPAHPWDIERLIIRCQRKTPQPAGSAASATAMRNGGGGGGSGRTLLEDVFAGIVTDTYTIPEPKYLQPITMWAERAADIGSVPAGSGGAATSDDSGEEDTAAAVARSSSSGRRKCALFTDAAACRAFLAQSRQPILSVPRGNATCGAGGCGFGNCHHDLGLCMCPAGWTGADCSQPLKRPCTHRKRGLEDPIGLPISHIHSVTKQVQSRCWGEEG